MRETARFACDAALALAAGVLCGIAAGEPPKPGPAQMPPGIGKPVTVPLVTPTPTPWPDIVVKRTSIGPAEPSPGSIGLPAHNVQVGETITLVCELEIVNKVAANTFYVKWSIDGQKTCGDGAWALTNPPTCAFLWPSAGGATAAITYVPRAAGNHVYSCDANLDNSLGHVEEAKLGNNWKELPFTATKLLTPPHVGTRPVPVVPHGPRIWR